MKGHILCLTLSAMTLRAAVVSASPGSSYVELAGEVRDVRLHVDKALCQSCAAHIREALLKVDGVKNVEVVPEEKRVVVKFDPQRSDTARIIAELKKAGFEARESKS